MVGESGINALVALGHGVPIVLVTGDDVTAAEAERICPGIHSAVVKTAVSRFAADSMHPQDACDLIRARAEQAVAGLEAAVLPEILLPATLTITFRNPDLAELATSVAGVDRIGSTSAALTDNDPVRLYRTFLTVVQLTRGIAE